MQNIDRKLSRAFEERMKSPSVHRAIKAAESNGMKPVLANRDGRLLLIDPHSHEHFLFSPTGALGEYDTKKQITDIDPGEPIPDKYLGESWTPIDPVWRHLVESDNVSRITM